MQCNSLAYAAGRLETVLIAREIAHLFSSWPPQSNASDPQDALEHALAGIDPDSCLFLAAVATSKSPDVPSVIGGWVDVLEA